MVIFQWLWTSFITAKGVLGLHTFWIKEDGLLEKTSYNETMYPYSTIRKFVLRDSYMLIQFTNWSGFFIPRREINDEEGWKAVGKQLLDYIKKH
jgi:hypothetical protein